MFTENNAQVSQLVLFLVIVTMKMKSNLNKLGSRFLAVDVDFHDILHLKMNRRNYDVVDKRSYYFSIDSDEVQDI